MDVLVPAASTSIPDTPSDLTYHTDPAASVASRDGGDGAGVAGGAGIHPEIESQGSLATGTSTLSKGQPTAPRRNPGSPPARATSPSRSRFKSRVLTPKRATAGTFVRSPKDPPLRTGIGSRRTPVPGGDDARTSSSGCRPARVVAEASVIDPLSDSSAVGANGGRAPPPVSAVPPTGKSARHKLPGGSPAMASRASRPTLSLPLIRNEHAPGSRRGTGGCAGTGGASIAISVKGGNGDCDEAIPVSSSHVDARSFSPTGVPSALDDGSPRSSPGCAPGGGSRGSGARAGSPSGRQLVKRGGKKPQVDPIACEALPHSVGMFHSSQAFTPCEIDKLQECNAFYTPNIIEDTLIPLITQCHPVSLRSLDWLATNYARTHVIARVHRDEKGRIDGIGDIYNDYADCLRTHHRVRFDPFQRHDRIYFKYAGTWYQTTVAQVTFVRWAIDSGLLGFIETHLDEVNADLARAKGNALTDGGSNASQADGLGSGMGRDSAVGDGMREGGGEGAYGRKRGSKSKSKRKRGAGTSQHGTGIPPKRRRRTPIQPVRRPCVAYAFPIRTRFTFDSSSDEESECGPGGVPPRECGTGSEACGPGFARMDVGNDGEVSGDSRAGGCSGEDESSGVASIRPDVYDTSPRSPGVPMVATATATPITMPTLMPMSTTVTADPATHAAGQAMGVGSAPGSKPADGRRVPDVGAPRTKADACIDSPTEERCDNIVASGGHGVPRGHDEPAAPDSTSER